MLGTPAGSSSVEPTTIVANRHTGAALRDDELEARARSRRVADDVAQRLARDREQVGRVFVGYPGGGPGEDQLQIDEGVGAILLGQRRQVRPKVGLVEQFGVESGD